MKYNTKSRNNSYQTLVPGPDQLLNASCKQLCLVTELRIHSVVDLHRQNNSVNVVLALTAMAAISPEVNENRSNETYLAKF